MNLIELVRKLLESPKADVVAAIEASAREIFQDIWQRGHDKAYADGKARERDLSTRITQLEGELTTERTAIEGPQLSTPVQLTTCESPNAKRS